MAIEILKSNPVYSKAFKWITENSSSNVLPYHNITHLLSVFSSCYDASEHYNIIDIYGASGEIELCLSALFHDVNHSGGELSDDKNVKNAIIAFGEFYSTLKPELQRTFNKETVIQTIRQTQYPYEITDNTELTLFQRILRDADLTSAFDGDWIQSVIFGLMTEMGGTSIPDRISQQINFILSTELCTDWGKSKLDNCKGRILNELANLKSIMDNKKVNSNIDVMNEY